MTDEKDALQNGLINKLDKRLTRIEATVYIMFSIVCIILSFCFSAL
jgi:hypothetical protein